MSAGDDPLATARGTSSRKRLLGKAVLAAVAVGGGFETLVTATGSAQAGAASTTRDDQILNFLLELEQLQAAFFQRAARNTRLAGELRQFAQVVSEQDDAHANALRSMLGPGAKPTRLRLGPQPRDDAAFMSRSVALKEGAVAAYIGEAPNLAAAHITRVATITSVEARHAAWIRSAARVIPAPRAADHAEAPRAVTGALERSGIVKHV
jgi:hypothetical protein